MSIIKNAKEFFGLAPVDMEHDDAYYDDEPRYASHGSAAYAPARDYGYEYDRYTPAPVTPVREERSYAPTVVAVEVSSYIEATEIGEPFRDGDAVVFDLTRMEAGENKRIVDFAAGLCFALRGRMINVSKGLDTPRRVFAIIPESADILQSELERAASLR